MMKKIFFLIVITQFLLPALNMKKLFGQQLTTMVLPQAITFQRQYLNAANETAYDIKQTADSGFILVGQAYNFGSPTFWPDAFLTKTDKYGNVVWSKRYDGSFIDRAGSVYQTTDGGYVVSGILSTGGGDMQLFKTDANGNLLWTKRYGDYFAANTTEGDARVTVTNDGGFIMVSYTDSTGSPNDPDILIVKTDSAGNVSWTKFYDSSSDSTESAAWIEQTSDGGYILCAATNVATISGDVMLMKLNTNGDTLWTKIYDLGQSEGGGFVNQTTDGGYIVGGTMDSTGGGHTDAYLMKTDSSGTVQWIKRYGNIADQDGGYFMQQTLDGGYMIGGYTGVVASFNWNYWLIKTDNNGDTVWTKKYGANTFKGVGWAAMQTSDKGYVITGSGALNTAPGNSDIFLIKTDSMGNSGCDESYYPFGVQTISATVYSKPFIQYTGNNTGPVAAITNAMPLTYSVLCCHNPLQLVSDTILCSGHTINIEASGAYSYQWSNAQTTPSISVSPGSSTSYFVIGQNGVVGCDTLSVNVMVIPALVANAGTDVTICANDTITLNASGGTSYLWSPAAGLSDSTVANPVATPTVTTTYTVIVTGINCDPDTDMVVVTVNPLPVLSYAPASPSYCAGESVTVTASGAISYTWFPSAGLSTTTGPTVIASPSVTTTYSVAASNAQGCSDTSSITVTVNPSPAATVSGTNIICSGTTTTITASGGTSYSWSTGASGTTIMVSPADTTTYTVTAFIGSCTDTASIIVYVTQTPTVSISGNNSVCAGSSVTLTATGGGTYTWSTGASSPSLTDTPMSTTVYSVVATNNGCSDTATQTVTLDAVPNPSISGNSSICNGTSTVLTATGGTSYAWDTGATTASITVSPVISPTTYTVTASNGTCTATASFTVNVITTPTATITGSSAVCIGNSVTLTASGGGTYVWSTGSTSGSINVSPTVSSTYSVVVFSGGCSDTASFTVIAYTPPVASINGTTQVCSGSSVTLTASGGSGYFWSTGETSTSITATLFSTSTYSVVALNGACSDTAFYTVTVLSGPTADAGPDIIYNIGATDTLNGSGGGTYSWSPSTGLSCTSCANPVVTTTTNITYTLVVTDPSGCQDEDSANILVQMNCSAEEGEIFIPDAFSPNNDNSNDLLFVRGGGILHLYFAVYDRWGTKVFETFEQDQGWDGNYKGSQLNPAVFVYVLKATCYSGEEFIYKGNVTLFR